jgi:hypothetical protein
LTEPTTGLPRPWKWAFATGRGERVENSVTYQRGNPTDAPESRQDRVYDDFSTVTASLVGKRENSLYAACQWDWRDGLISKRMRFCCGAVMLWAVGTTLVGCGGSPSSPSGSSLQVTAISPSTGTSFGGTAVTITGRNFTTGTSLTFGGTPATDVVVNDSASITATTPVHPAGTVDVSVKSGTGAEGTLRQAFQYVRPTVANSPPVVSVLTAQGSRASEPSAYANVDEAISVAATVTDAETPVTTLTFDWSAEAGVVIGTGPTVTWKAPHSAGRSTIRLTVTETYTTPDPSGLPVQSRYVVTGTVDVDVHDEASEIAAMAKNFLVRFSQSNVSPNDVMTDFKDGCGAGGTGKQDEYNQVVANRQNFRIVDWSVGEPRVTVNFKSLSPYRSRSGDAWAAVDVRWVSQCLVAGVGCTSAGGTRLDAGTDWVTTQYDAQTRRWWICDSDYEGTSASSLQRYLR